ncbi:hypothetical protein C4D60_Mb05t15970 [Musa balbisiana]|uniref:RRM domain-containing protein n=1 Tax=Musa balbisiana TaxID=52838 RepID=A0A4S8JWI0_MUSBA|nr:hypothetical protein C4D60_Mb05t15970 [Musa balbisiana]
MATGLLPAASLASPPPSSSLRARRHPVDITSSTSSSSSFLSRFPSIRSSRSPWPSAATSRRRSGGFSVSCCLPPTPSTKLYVSGTFSFSLRPCSFRDSFGLNCLSFRTTEESLRNAFQNFGQLVEVNLVMDRIANRPRGFAFLRYATEEESKMAIEGMHGKFLDGRVIFVEVAKPRSEVRQASRQTPQRFSYIVRLRINESGLGVVHDMNNRLEISRS